MSMDDKVRRLDAARTKLDELVRKKERLSGQLETCRKRVDELEKRCREEFECEPSELPKMIDDLNKEAEEAVSKAERLLITTP